MEKQIVSDRPVIREMSGHESLSFTGDYKSFKEAQDERHQLKLLEIERSQTNPFDDEFDKFTDAKYDEQRRLKPDKTPKSERFHVSIIKDDDGKIKEVKYIPRRSHIAKPEKQRQLNRSD